MLRHHSPRVLLCAFATLYTAELRAQVDTHRADRRLFQVELSDWESRQSIAVGPDGTVYTSDGDGLYAIAPDGQLLWFSPGSGGGLAIDVADDGTIFCGVTEATRPEILRALDPAGNVLWTFVAPTSFRVIAGPNLGPDGNLYAAQEQALSGGLGIFSLDRGGALRWSNIGDPPIDSTNTSTEGSEIVFGSGAAYVGVIHLRSGNSAITYAVEQTDGNQRWTTASRDLDAKLPTFPRTDPSGRLIGAYGQTGMQALRGNGSLAWRTLHPGHPSLLRMPTIDAAGNVYTGDLVDTELWSLDRTGRTRWVLAPETASVQSLAATPDGRTLVVCGIDGSGDGFVRGVDPTSGSTRFEVPLPRELGWQQTTTCLTPKFDRSRPPSLLGTHTVYVTTRFGDVR